MCDADGPGHERGHDVVEAKETQARVGAPAARGTVMKWWGRRDDDYAEEIQAHIDMEVKANIERGLSPDEAKRAAHLTFGNVALVRETLWQARRWHWLEAIRQNIPTGLRLIAPG